MDLFKKSSLIKSFFMIIVFGLLFIFITACNIFTPDEPIDEPVKVSGVLSDKIYKNEFFDFSLTIPSHWYFLSDAEPLTFFSNRPKDGESYEDLKIECLALNDVSGDTIEITIEKVKTNWTYDTWKSRGGHFNDLPKAFESIGDVSTNINNKLFDGRGYILLNETNDLCGRAAFYYINVEEYIFCITIISDNYFDDDAPSKKYNSIGRMIDWIGTYDKPSTKMIADGGGYYFNDIISPSYSSTMLYSYYRRNEPFTIAGVTFNDCIPLNNGNSFGVGKVTDAVFYLDGKTYKELNFTIGVIDEMIVATTKRSDYAAIEILFDDKQVWEERFYAFSKPEFVTIDITGVEKLTFRIRDNWELTSLCIADPIISEEKLNVDKTVDIIDNTIDFFDGAIPYYMDNNAKLYNGSDNKTFTVDGKSFNKGLILCDNRQYDCDNYFNLGGKFEVFNFSVGVIAETLYPNNGWLNVYLDGEKILDVPIDYDIPTEFYSLDVSGGHILCIQGSSGVDSGIHQADYALYNMTLGKVNIDETEKINPGSYKLISEVCEPFSLKGTRVYDGTTKFRGHYMGDVFYNEGIAMESIYALLSSPLDSATPAKASFNIGGNFKYLTFTAGRVDKSHVKDDTLVVLGDGEELARYNLIGTDFPKKYEVNVEGVKVLQFKLLGMAMITRGKYMVADIAVHTDEVENVEFYKPTQSDFPNEVDLMERFKPYEYMSAEGNGHDAVRYFNGIYDGTDNKKYFTIDGINHNRGFVLSTCVYLSLDNIGGGMGASLAGFTILALVASSEVSQASFACFNLQENYKTITFNIGVVDGQDETDKRTQPYDKLYVIADDNVVGEYILTGNMETTEITVDVNNCERLAFWLDHNRNSYSYGIFDAKLIK